MKTQQGVLRKLLGHEINKNLYYCLGLTLVSMGLIISRLISSLNIKIELARDITINSEKSIYSIDNNLVRGMTDAFLTTLNEANTVINIMLVIVAILVISREWAGRSNAAYIMLNLPVARWKILLSKFVIPIIYFIINYAAVTLIFMVSRQIFASKITTLKAREYFLDSFIGADIESMIFSLILAITIVSVIFLVLLASKIYGVRGFIISLIAVFLVPYGIMFTSISRKLLMSINMMDYSFWITIGIVLTIITIVNIKLFKDKIIV